MPVISRFYGVLIAMYFNDQNPPHFHAKYSGYEALIDFDGSIIEGEVPARVERFVQEWVGQHRLELETVIWPNGADLAPEFLKKLQMQQMQSGSKSQSQ